MNKTYIELKTFLPFIIEYLYFDFVDINISSELFEYHKVYGLIDNSLHIYNKQYPHLTARSFKTLKIFKSNTEEALSTLGRKLEFRYPEELEFYKSMYKRIDEILLENGY